MSTKYKSSKDVPTDALISRLKELSDAITGGRDSQEREFTMRIPAECDRDADLVIGEAASRLTRLQSEVERLRGRCGELEYHADRMLAATKANDFALDEEAQYKADKLMFDATEDYLIFKEDEAQRLRQQAAESAGGEHD